MPQNIDDLALSCNILLEKLIYLYSNSLINKEQLVQNSKIKAKFLAENINNIETRTVKQDSIRYLNILTGLLSSEEKEALTYKNPI